jgi:HPt (histidine-containing phosphotransfer) domain-containing protein
MTQTSPSSPPAVTGGFTRKYAPLLIGAALFLVLNFIVLFFSYQGATAAKVDALAINLAGRQRMLSQRLVKTLLKAQAATDPKGIDEALKEMALSQRLFDTTLQGFDQGALVTGGDGKDVFLKKISYAPARTPLEDAIKLWTPYKELLAPLLALPPGGGSLPEAALKPAIGYASANNLKILALMNDMTFKLEEDSRRRATTLQTVQLSIFAMIVLDGCFFFYFALVRLRHSDRQEHEASEKIARSNAELAITTEHLSQAKAETDSIFETVRQGIFLIDENYLISEQHSSELHAILGVAQPGGQSLLHLLKQVLPEKQFTMARDYFALLFNADKREKQVVKVNPLAQVEAHFPSPGGGLATKTLQFSFRRVYKGQAVARIFVSVSDVSQQVQLEARLRESEQKKERQLELLLSILHVEPARLAEFLALSERELSRQTTLLREGENGQGEAGPRTLEALFRSVHNIKGNAALLQITHFETLAHEMEDQLADLRKRPAITGDDLLPVVVRQAALTADLAEVRELVEKLAGIQRGIARPAPLPQGPSDEAPAVPTTDDLANSLQQLASTLASRHGCDLRFVFDGLDTRTLRGPQRDLVRDVCIQLVRNSIAHGIEPSEQRRAAGKPPQATLSIRALSGPAARPGCFSFAFRDDGRGLQFEKIRAKATAAGLLAPGEPAEPARLAGLIFAPGFSTADATTTDAGRGIGMDIVKRRIVNDSGGEIKIATAPGQFCEFQFHVPV